MRHNLNSLGMHRVSLQPNSLRLNFGWKNKQNKKIHKTTVKKKSLASLAVFSLPFELCKMEMGKIKNWQWEQS